MEDEKKLYSEDDIHNLLGEAFDIIRESFKSQDQNIRLGAAIRLLENPLTFALIKQQMERQEFPRELPRK